MDYIREQQAAEAGIYARQQTIPIMQRQHVAVIGCGGIGSWVALFLALAGVEHIELFDSDLVSDHNLNRFPLGPDSIGKVKSEAMAIHIEGLRAGVRVVPRLNFNPEDEAHQMALSNCSWMIVTTDSLKSRAMCYEYATRHRNSYIEAAAEGELATVTFSPAEFATELEEQPGYQSVPVWVGPCVMAAAIAANYVLHGSRVELTHQVEWTGTQLDMRTINESEPLPPLPITEGEDEIAEQVYDRGSYLEVENEQS